MHSLFLFCYVEQVKIGSRKINPVQYRKHIAYVMQDDALMATATPREALMFSATMRLPSTNTASDMTAMVDKLLADLGLNECADVIIGGPLIKGISGGQRKRTSVGVELIADPAVSKLGLSCRCLCTHGDHPDCVFPL